MSETIASLSRKSTSAGELQSVVRTMKALAAASIGQYEQSVRALVDYDRTVELGLGACLRAREPASPHIAPVTRADHNIHDLLEDLNRNFHRLRQTGIDEELFDVVAGAEALSHEHRSGIETRGKRRLGR